MMSATNPQDTTYITTYIAQAPESQRGIFRRALDGGCSARSAIKAKCLACCNFDRDEVRSCTVEICPLWRFRPYQQKAIRPDRCEENAEGSIHG